MILVLQFSLLTAAITYGWRKDVLFPGFIVSVCWAAVSTVHLFQDSVGEIELRTQLLIGLGTSLFSLGAMLGAGASSRLPENIKVLTGIPSEMTQRLATLVSTALVGMMVMSALEIGRNGPTDNWLVNLKLDMVEGEGYGLLRYGLPVTYIIAFSGALRLAVHGFSVASLVAIIAGLTGGLITTGRGVVLHLLVLILIPMICLGKARLRAVAGIGAIFFLFFLVLGMYLGKADGLNVGEGESDFSSLWGMITTYAVGGAGALNYFVERGAALDGGTNTFRVFIAIAHAIGLSPAPKELVEGFVYVPAPTNVYSYYYPLFADFGIVVAVVAQIPIGMLLGWLYRTVRLAKASAFHLLLFSASCFALMMQFQQDYLIVSLSIWVQYTVIGFFFLRDRITTKKNSVVADMPTGRIDSIYE